MDIVVKGRNVEVPAHYREHVENKLARLERYDRKTIRADVELIHERNPRQAKNCQRVEITMKGRGPAARAEACAGDFYAALDAVTSKLENRLRRMHDRRKVHYGRRNPTSVAEATADPVGQPLPDGATTVGAASTTNGDDTGSTTEDTGGTASTAGAAATAVGSSAGGGAGGPAPSSAGTGPARTSPAGTGPAGEGPAGEGTASTSPAATSTARTSTALLEAPDEAVQRAAAVPVQRLAEEDGHEPGRIVREKEHTAKPMTVDQALSEMELVGHDFYLFSDADTGRPSVVYRRSGFAYGVVRLAD